MKLAVGLTIFVFDENKRVYVGGTGRPVYRAHFVPKLIKGETLKSWILEDDTKVNKQTLAYRMWSGGRAKIWPTSQAVDDTCFVHDNRATIAQTIYQVTDAATLRAIQELLK